MSKKSKHSSVRLSPEDMKFINNMGLKVQGFLNWSIAMARMIASSAVLPKPEKDQTPVDKAVHLLHLISSNPIDKKLLKEEFDKLSTSIKKEAKKKFNDL